MRLILAIFSALFAFAPVVSAAGFESLPELSPENTIVISDVDDTIRLSQILDHNPLHLNTAINYTSFRMPFAGTPELFQALASRGVEIHYVSTIPKPLAPLAKRFLKANAFPEGKLWSRTDKFRSTHKIEAIREIARASPGKAIVLIGDNGERDSTIFHRIAQTEELRDRIGAVFVHRLYDRAPVNGAVRNEVKFLTSADLGMGMGKLGLLDKAEVLKISRTVRDALQADSAGARHLALPFFSELSEKENQQILAQTAWPNDPEISRVQNEIKRVIEKRTRDQKPMSCLKGFLLRLFADP